MNKIISKGFAIAVLGTSIVSRLTCLFGIHVVSGLFLRGFPESSSSEEEENLDDYE